MGYGAASTPVRAAGLVEPSKLGLAASAAARMKQVPRVLAAGRRPAMAKKDEAKGEGEAAAAVETADSPLLDLSDAAVKRMLKVAKKRGWVTQDELNAILPSEEISSDQIEDMNAMLSEMGINVVDNEDAEEAEKENAERGRGAGGRRGRRDQPHDGRRNPQFGACRADRRSGPHVSSRNGLGGAAVARGRDRHRQAHRGRSRHDDRRLMRKPADLRRDHRLARGAQQAQSCCARSSISKRLTLARRQEAGETDDSETGDADGATSLGRLEPETGRRRRR